tara:strand:- start:294 stop:875 length:582 start_codon:yes stop_codon:yes gene_type:complete
MYENYFLTSIPDEFKLHVKEIPQECPTGSFYQAGWDKTCFRKVEFFEEICKENFGDMFIFSDVDIQFFGNFKNEMIEELGDCDIACQDDITTFSSGFFICKCNDTTLKMFQNMKEFYNREDQTSLNDQIHITKHKFLSKRFFTFGHIVPRPWNGEDFDIPDDILVHHANWVAGIDNKIKILDLVREKFNAGKI